MNKMTTVEWNEDAYTSPMLGNGNVVTTIGPTGFHGGYCPEEEAVNRTIFWAGRRLRDARSINIRIPRCAPDDLFSATIPLIRFGRLIRTLEIDGEVTSDRTWRQSVDYETARVCSELDHEGVVEQTESRVCLSRNVMVFRTTLENQSPVAKRIGFTLEYAFGDHRGDCPTGIRFKIRRPHPDDVAFGDVGGVRSLDDLESRAPHERESLSVQMEIERYLGEVHLGRFPACPIRETEAGGRILHSFELAPGESRELWHWVVLSDRLTYTHFPDLAKVRSLIKQHQSEWDRIWNASRVETGLPELDLVRQSSLYTVRCHTSAWTIPPGYLSTTWEGRAFHDEFFSFMGLISSNLPELAERVPNYRLSTLSMAQQRSGGRGAFYAWEATELGEESAPYGHWVDERFIHGQFSESVWQYFLHTGDEAALERYYPVMKGCVEWMLHDVVVRREDGGFETRSMTDIDEGLYPVEGSLYVTCATIRCLENAVQAARLLDVDCRNRDGWASVARALRQSLPIDIQKNHYTYSKDADLPNGAGHLGMVFPFSIDVHSELAANTLSTAYEAFRKEHNNGSSDQVLAYTWMWGLSFLATALFYQGRGDEGFSVLREVPQVVGPFMAPCEQMREEEGAFLPWFTTGAGIYLYALNAMFVQVLDLGATLLLPAVPSALENCTFDGLLASDGVRVSGRVEKGSVCQLKLQSSKKLSWRFRIPRHYLAEIKWTQALSVYESGTDDRFALCKVQLEEGGTALIV